MSTSSLSRIERITSDNKKNHATRQYALIRQYPHKNDISLINHIEYGFIFDGIINQALLNIFERKNIHPEYYHSNEDILAMSQEARAKLLITEEFTNFEQLNKYCLDNYVDIISIYKIES